MEFDVGVAVAVACVYALLSAVHLYWAVGGRIGSVAVIPHVAGTAVFTPGVFATVLVALALAAAGALVLCRVGLLPWPLPDAWLRPGMYLIGTLFGLRALGDFRLVGFFKRVRGTTFARLDSWFFSPLCALLAAAVLWLG